MNPDTPVALVERATWPDMRVATGTLDTIVDVRDSEGIEPPAITVIGEVAGTRDRVQQFFDAAGGASHADGTGTTTDGDDTANHESATDRGEGADDAE
jgi:uroporphyrin-III C-methyltransferase